MGYLGLIPGATAWEWMVVSKLIPLFLLLVSILAADCKPTFKQVKAFWNALRKVNDHLDLFGDEQRASGVEQRFRNDSLSVVPGFLESLLLALVMAT